MVLYNFFASMVVIYIICYFIMLFLFSFLSFGQLSLGIWSLSNFSFILDNYSHLFSMFLFLVSGSVFIWSYYYMDVESNYRRFMSIVILFVSSMLFLIFVPSLIFILIGWDGLGVTSFLLVIYYSNKKSLSSGMITALTNRVGDVFFLAMLPFFIWGFFNWTLSILFIFLCMTKSAQYPFSSWLPAAMAAPTPVSALVHSSTLVTAGVYMLIRFDLCDMTALVLIGSVTMLMAGFCACGESDLKKIVALSTLSQLGIMMISLGLVSKKFCFFHLLSHALFKALLFMCVGVFIHTIFGSQDSRGFSMSALLYPGMIMVIANLALCGFPFMAGFYSKDAIVESFYNNSFSLIFLTFFMIGIGLTACYSMKMMFISYFSNEQSEAVSKSEGYVRWFVKIPLLTLSIFSMGGGWILMSLLSSEGLVLSKLDKMFPLGLISFGLVLGFFLSKISFSPVMMNMFFLTPSFQKSSGSSIDTISSLSCIDNGYVEWLGPTGLHQSSEIRPLESWMLFFPFFLLVYLLFYCD